MMPWEKEVKRPICYLKICEKSSFFKFTEGNFVSFFKNKKSPLGN